MNPDGELDPLPGQLVLPGMPDPQPDLGPGQAVLPGLDDLRDPGPADDPELAAVARSRPADQVPSASLACTKSMSCPSASGGIIQPPSRWENLQSTSAPAIV